ncbi:Uncharacterised protein [Mycobacteroides abscessus subsp. abscessus]|nr:Uncharacterised protein [Mycobacteroides abscessus subsp. abscessus]
MPPAVFCTMTGSPFCAFSKNQRASSVLTFRQPWLTLATPCWPTDHGAACRKMPLLESRVAYSTSSL